MTANGYMVSFGVTKMSSFGNDYITLNILKTIELYTLNW